MKADGGSAFPARDYIVPQDLEERHVRALGKTQGMTLRDYFAAHCPLPTSDMREWIDEAKMRYEYADAMLAERAK